MKKLAQETPAPGAQVIPESHAEEFGGQKFIGPSLWEQTVIDMYRAIVAANHTGEEAVFSEGAKGYARSVLESLGYECPEE